MLSIVGWNFLAWAVVFFASLGLFFGTFSGTYELPAWVDYAMIPWVLLTLSGFVQSGLDIYYDISDKRENQRYRL